jgi:hypothetical protein
MVKYYIDKLGLKEHPEGGYFKEIYRASEFISISNLPERYSDKRSLSTSIYFLLDGYQKSTFHKIKSDEIWHFYDGSPVRIFIINPDGDLSEIIIGRNLDRNESFQCIVEKNCWFCAEVCDKESFALIGCTVAPGFEFQDFELGVKSDLIVKFPRYKDLIENFTRCP